MRGNDVIKPHRQIGQILRQNFLNFTAQSFRFFLIHLHSNLVRKRFDAGIAIVPAIGAVRRMRD
jgi:hypothetical protein